MFSSAVMIVKKHRVVVIVGFLLGGLLACVQWNIKASSRLEASPPGINTHSSDLGRNRLYFNERGRDTRDEEILPAGKVGQKPDMAEGWNEMKYNGRVHRVRIDQTLLDELSLTWLFDELKLNVRLSCSRGKVGVFTDSEHLVVCLKTERLQSTVSVKVLTRFQAKLLVLKNIVDDLGGDGYAMFLTGNKLGERSLDFDEQVVSSLEKLMARKARDTSELKQIEPKARDDEASKPALGLQESHGPQDNHELDIERALDLSFLNKQMDSDDSSEDDGANEPQSTDPPRKSYLPRKNNLQEDGKRGGQVGFHLPKNLVKQFRQQTKQGGVYRPWGRRSSISKALGKSNFISPSLSKLQGYTFVRQRTLQERGFHKQYSFTSSQLQQRVGNITVAVGKVTSQRMEAARTSLDPNLISRGKVRNEDEVYSGISH